MLDCSVKKLDEYIRLLKPYFTLNHLLGKKQYAVVRSKPDYTQCEKGIRYFLGFRLINNTYEEKEERKCLITNITDKHLFTYDHDIDPKHLLGLNELYDYVYKKKNPRINL